MIDVVKWLILAIIGIPLVLAIIYAGALISVPIRWIWRIFFSDDPWG